MSETKETPGKKSPGHKYFLFSKDENGEIFRDEFDLKRDLLKALRSISSDRIIGVFKGRQLEVRVEERLTV